jgi:hypothetical protein
MGAFLRTAIDDNNLIRGAARLIAAPRSAPYPTSPGSLAQLLALGTTSVNDVQTLTTTGSPSGGTLTLSWFGDVTTGLPALATAVQVQAALQALPNVGNNVTCTGGPLPTAIVITASNYLAGQLLPVIIGNASALTGGTTPAVNVVHTTPGSGQYDPISPWFDLGATKNGIRVSRNQTEDVFDVDQIYGDLDARPTNWEMQITTALSQFNLATLQVAWELGNTFIDTTPLTGSEEHLGIGLPTAYTHRRMAILYQRPNGLIRAIAFRNVVKMPQASELTHMKSGEQVTIPVVFRALIDTTVQDPTQNIGEVIDQALE